MAKKFERRFRPYAIELGLIVYHWNQLQENLGRLFWAVTGIPNGAVAMAVWYEIQSDRTQRQMLRAAAESGLVKIAFGKLAAEKMVEVVWIITESNKLGDHRNNALHSPFAFSFAPEDERPTFTSAHQFGNPRAKRLKDKDLLIEFRWYRQRAAVLAAYASEMELSIRSRDDSLPERPQLPHHGQSPTRKKSNRKKTAK